jgi:hypothetical protein
MRKLILLALLVFTATFIGCSFSTELVVVNLSDRPVEVTYHIKDFPGPFSPPETPAIKGGAEMNDDSPWKKLSSDQYRLYPESRTVAVNLKPNNALLIGRVQGPGMSDGPNAAESFPIRAIMVVGAYGKMILQGEQVRKSFTEESKKAYSLTYK